MQGIRSDTLLADKGYDADALPGWLKQHDVAAVIPPKANRKVQGSCDWQLYKERHVIECRFGKLKYFRRIATLRKRPAISRKCWPSLRFCCGCADTSTEPSMHNAKNRFHGVFLTTA